MTDQEIRDQILLNNARLVGNKIAMAGAHSNIDSFYGPYKDVTLALSFTDKVKAVGLTVGIYKDENYNEIVEYWYKKSANTSIDDGWELVEKSDNYELRIDSITHTSDTINNKITFNIKASGKGFKVLTTIYLGSVKLADVNTILNSEDGLNIVINAPDNPGNYIYTISLVDSVLGNGALTTYTVIWKEIDIKIDQNSTIYRYKVKSFLNLQEAEFSFQIYKIDLVDITLTKVCFGSDTSTARGFITCSNESYQNIQISSLVSEGLESGDKIWINVTGTRSDTGLTIEAPIVEVVLLTAPGIFSNIEGTIPDVVYNGLTFSVTLKFEAETNGNYKVVIKDGSTEVYNSSLLAYTTNTLALRLNDPELSPSNLTSYHILKVYIGDSEKIKEDYAFNLVILKYVSLEELLNDVSGQNGFKFSNKLRFITQGDGITLTSYMLDMVCYIPYTETVTNVFKFGDITINREVISLGSSISYPTPLQLTVTIGIMRNVMSTYTYTDKTYYYDAIFINGVLCGKWPNVGNVNIPANTLITPSSDITDTISSKIRLYYNVSNPINLDPESYVLEKNYIARNPRSEDNTSVPTFVITPLPNIITKANLRDLGYNDSLIESFSDSSITIGSGSEAITYQVIDNTTYKVGEFGSLGQEKYKLNLLINDFCRAYDVDSSQQQGESENARQDRLLDELKSKVKGNPSKIPSTYLSLTSLIVKSKNLLQKYVKVPCSWSYIDSTGTEHSGYLLASSLGTSTLEFALPNFTFAFYTSLLFSTKASVSLIPKIIRTLDNMLDYSTEINKNTLYYTDKELVAKADYMESSHLNNTPTAMYYNAITTLQDGYYALDKNGNQIVDSNVVVPPGGTPEYIKILENPNNNKLNAIEGMPVALEIGGINYGSFMLNLGKKASAIGFGSNGISLEGTSNDDNSGMSSRFDFAAGDTKALQYFNTISDISDIDNISEVNSDFAKFIRGGLEYRYSAADLDDIGKDIVETTVVDGLEQTSVVTSALPEFKRIFKMWYWVYTNLTYNRLKFEEMFNFEYAALYYIQMMIFGQTDNLGKNCMFDLFDTNGQWYVRPYDMDSQAGLNNGGIDELSPVIEISKEFVLDQDTKDITTVRYGGKSTERFPYSSKTSNLWIRFYRNLKDEIEIFYEYLRNLGYSAESVISLCKKEVIDKLKIHLYNIDFRNKYLSNTDVGLLFAYGNRWVKFQDWIKIRFDFCDTYFGYSKYETNTKTRSTPYTITYSLPWYTIYSYNDAHATYTTSNWGYTCNLLFQSVTNQTMIFSPEYIVDDDGIFYSGFSRVIPRVKLNNLISYNGSWDNLSNVVDLSENTYMQEMTVDSISVGGNGCIPTSVLTLTITNSSGIPQLNDYTNLKTLNLSNCEGDIYLNNCPMLLTISIDGCKLINFTLVDCGTSTLFVDVALNNTTFNLIVLNGCYINYLNLKSKKLNISFTGSETYIKTLRLDEATILNRELDITNLKVDNFILNSITSVKVITRTQKSYNFLGLLRGAISQWGNTENTFDGSYFANINSIRMIESITDTVISNLLNDTYNSSIKFRLMHCTEILNVKNLDVSTDDNLFYNCNKLVSITNSNITASGRGMFYRCYNLQILPTNTSTGNSTIILSTTDGSNMFNSCLKLSYASIEKVLTRNSVTKYWNSAEGIYLDEEISGVSPTEACLITDYDSFLYNKSYTGNTTINLDKYAFATNMSSCFCVYATSDSDPTINKNTTTAVTVTFTGRLSRLVSDASSTFRVATKHHYIVPSDVFEDCLLLTNLNFCFAHYTQSTLVVPTLPNNIGLTLNRTFYNSKINLTNLINQVDGKVYLPSKVSTCRTTFQKATLLELTEISLIFRNCTKIQDITNCFRGCINYTCTSQLDLSNSEYPVNVAGIFVGSATTIPYGFNGNWYSDPTESTYVIDLAGSTNMRDSNRVGPYYNTTITLNSPVLNISNILHPMNNVLQGAIIDEGGEHMTLLINISAIKCDRVCESLSFKDNQSNIQITNLLNILDANRAFNNVKLDSGNSITLPNTLRNASYMFANTNIITMPLGISKCTQLSDISYMFYNCQYLGLGTTTPFAGQGTDYFLPISVTNIDHLFDGCYRLHGGIPRNFIQTIEETQNGQSVITRNSLTSLICTFKDTGVLQLSSAFNPDTGYTLDISTMFPEVTDVTGMFYRLGSSSSYILALASNCFSKCLTCDNLFNSAMIKLPLNCNFTSATSMRFAFACSNTDRVRNIGSGFLDANSIGTKVDISGIFATNNNEDLNAEVQSKLSVLLAMKDKTTLSYTGMLYGYGPYGSETEYTYVQPSMSITSTMHAS